jgi:hypothetical protein
MHAMRPVEFYVERVRAFAGRPILVWAGTQCDDYASWWELVVIFDEPEASAGPVTMSEVNGRPYAELLIASPPGDLLGDLPIGRRAVAADADPDLDGRDRAASEELGLAVARALGLPFAIEPREAPHLRWWEVFGPPVPHV